MEPTKCRKQRNVGRFSLKSKGPSARSLKTALGKGQSSEKCRALCRHQGRDATEEVKTVGGIKKKRALWPSNHGNEWPGVKASHPSPWHSLSPLQGRREMQKDKGHPHNLSSTRSSAGLGSPSLSLSCVYWWSERGSQLLQWKTRTLCTPRAHLLHLPFLSPKEAYASRSLLIS